MLTEEMNFKFLIKIFSKLMLGIILITFISCGSDDDTEAEDSVVEDPNDTDGPINLNTLFSDDFESGTFGEEANGFSWGGKTNVSVVNDPNEVSNMAVQFLFKGSSDLTEDAFSELRFNLGGLYKEIWMKYRLYVPINYFHRRTPSSDNSKGYFMFWSGEYNNRSNTLIASSWWPSGDGNTVMNGQWKTNTETSQHYREESLSAMAIDRTTDLGKWQDVVVRVKVADHLTSNGAVQVWKNNELIYSNLEVDNYSEDNIKNGIEKGYLLGWSNAGFDTETKMMIDDFVIGESAEGIGFETN